MKPLVVTQPIAVPIEDVFEVLAHIEVAAEILPKITRAEILSGPSRGRGTRFAETRKIGKREFTMEFKVTEYNAPHSVRLVCDDQMGSVWDSVYHLVEEDGVTIVTLTMHCIPSKFTMKLMWPLMKILVKAGIKDDFKHFKEHLESVEL